FLEKLGEEMTLDLAEARAGQRLAHGTKIDDALIRRQPGRELLDFLFQQPQHAEAAAAAYLVLVGHDERDERAFALENADLAEQGSRVALLHFLGEDVLAVGQNDDFLAAADDVQEAFVVEEAEVSRAEPSVRGERLARRLVVVPVAREDVRSAREDLSVRGLGLAIDTNLDTGYRLTLGAEAPFAQRVERQDGRGFRQTVTGQHGPPHRLKILGELRIELRAAAAQDLELRSDGRVHRAEQQPADREPREPPHAEAQRQQAAEETLFPRPGGSDPGLDALPHGLVQARHAEQRGRLGNLRRAGDLGARDA